MFQRCVETTLDVWFLFFVGEVMKCKMQNSENSHGILGKGNTSTKPQFLGSMLIFGGVMTYTDTDLHESASIRQKFLQFSLRDF